MNELRHPPHLSGSYLVLETTNKCSLACVHCSVSEKLHPHHRQNGFLDPAIVEKLFADLQRVGARFDTLILFWLGEPLIHPQFEAIYRGALKANQETQVFGKIELHTNATHLNPAATEIALNNEDIEQVWHFSLDAASHKTYHRIKGMDRLTVVEENLTRFIEAKAERSARWPRGSSNTFSSASKKKPLFGPWAVCERADIPVRLAARHASRRGRGVFFRQLDCQLQRCRPQTACFAIASLRWD